MASSLLEGDVCDFGKWRGEKVRADGNRNDGGDQDAADDDGMRRAADDSADASRGHDREADIRNLTEVRK
jgi:hypothetical protein